MNTFDRFKEVLELYRGVIDVIVIGETWVKADRTQLYSIDGYHKVFSCRPDSRGGGLAVYVRSTISFDEVINEHFNGFHHVHISLDIGELPFHIHAVYRPPGFDLSAFFSKLDSICATGGRHSSSIIVGDINIPTNVSNCRIVDEYTNLLNCYNYSVSNNCPTRPASGNILDHTICSDALHCTVVNETIYTDISDHCLVLSTFRLQKPIEQRRLEKTIVYNQKLNIAFQNAMATLPEGSAEIKVQFVLNTYKALKEQFSRTVSVEAKIKGFCPWMSFDIWKLIKIKNNLLRSQKRNPNNIRCKELLDHVSKKVQRAKDQAKKEYFSKLFSTSNQKRIWTNINKILGRNKDTTNAIKLSVNGSLTSDDSSIANAFNDFFCSIGPQLAASIHSNQDINKFNTLTTHRASVFLEPASTQEVILLIKELKNGKSCGVDGISAEFMKLHHNVFAVLLRDLFNECASTGSFPDFLKVARVIPIHKGGNKSDINNYRPISILSVLSKVLEKLLVTRLANFLRHHDLLYNRQYGFREGASTWTAACELVDEIYGAMEERNIEGVLFLDLKKAFDTIDHQVLLRKLEYYGIRGTANDLLRSYLTGRKQYVLVNGATSILKDVTVGVPQGSNVGPLLFLLYINDLANLKLNGHPRLFADDTSLSYQKSNANLIILQMKEDLAILQQYFDENMLSLNLSKTKFMLFHSPRLRIPRHADLIVNSTKIDKVYSFKYLGLTFDPNLHWHEHIFKLQREISVFCGVLRKISQYMPRKERLTMYYAFVQSKLQYLVSIWGAASKTSLRSLQSTQNRCLKVVYNRPLLYPTIRLFKESAESIIPIAGLREKECLVQMHNILTNPRTLHNQPLQQTSSRYALRSQAVLAISRPRTEAGKKCFLYYGACQYNALPLHIKDERNMPRYKKNVLKLIRDKIGTYLT